MNKKHLVGLMGLSISSFANAGGIMLYEVASDNAGLANAGAAARAQGPSTIASNPAGLSYLTGTQLSTGAQLLVGNIKFDRSPSNTGSGGNGDNALPPTPGVSLFTSHQLDDRWTMGFGAYGDFGLSESFGNSWTGRYYAQDASIAGLSLVPSLAYRLNDTWSIGLGVKAMYGILKTKTAINRAPFGQLDRSDGQYKYEDGTWGYGFNIGAIYSPQPGTRIGLAYTSEIDLDFEDRLDITGTGPLLKPLDRLNTKIEMSVPQTATLSLYQQLDSEWALLASINWQDWSSFGQIAIDVDTNATRAQSAALDANLKDTYQIALGAQYQATEKLLWNMGVAYDTSAVSDSHRSVVLPVGATWRLGTGFTYAVDKNTSLNLSWDFIWMGDLPVEQTKLLSGEKTNGQFSNAWIQALGGNATWRF